MGGHTPGQAIVTVATAAGPVILASDAVHYYEELERDRPFATVANLAEMYAAFDQIRELGTEPGARVVAGHDPLVAERFGGRAGSGDVIQVPHDERRADEDSVLNDIKPGAAVGFVGLGKMGAPMATRLAVAGYQVQGYDVSAGRNQVLGRTGGREPGRRPRRGGRGGRRGHPHAARFRRRAPRPCRAAPRHRRGRGDRRHELLASRS